MKITGQIGLYTGVIKEPKFNKNGMISEAIFEDATGEIRIIFDENKEYFHHSPKDFVNYKYQLNLWQSM